LVENYWSFLKRSLAPKSNSYSVG